LIAVSSWPYNVPRVLESIVDIWKREALHGLDNTRAREHLMFEIATVEPLTLECWHLNVGAMKLAVEICPLIAGNGELAVERVTI
jgi:hypothetical protein